MVFCRKRNPDGSKYFVFVESNIVLPEEKAYILNKSTGRYECQLLPSSKLRGNGDDSKMGKTKSSSRSASRPAKSVGASSVEQYKDHRVRSGSVVSRGRSTVTAPIQRDERVPTFVNVHDESERQGKGTVPELVHYARECPVHWTSKITTQNMNVVLWSWAYVAQILATRVGQAPAMQDGELEARL